MRFALALALLLIAAPAGAATIVLDFEEEALTAYVNTSFVSAECACVEFAEAAGGWLYLEDGQTGHFLVAGEEGGRLLMTFLVPVTAISLDFGNDQTTAEFLGLATLEGLVGGQVVAFATVTPNANGAVDQTISIAYAGVLEQARFYMPQSSDTEPISPVVDNLVLTVPEPSLALLLAVVVGAVAVLPIRHQREPVLEHEINVAL